MGLIIILAALPYLSIDITVENLFHLHNEVRREYKKPLVGLSPELCKVAQSYAKLLQDRNEIRHDANGRVSDRLNRIGYKWLNCGENIQRAPFFYTEQDIMNAWMDSGVHRINVLGDYKEIGIGYYGFTYVVVFATPKR